MPSTLISNAVATTPAATDMIPLSRPDDATARQSAAQAIANLSAGGATVIDVTNPAYGAVGDGVTDDTAAVHLAVAAALAGSYNLYFPTGTYLMKPASNGVDIIEITSAITIYGDGPGSTILKFNDNSTYTYDGILITADSGVVTVRDLEIQGPATNDYCVYGLMKGGTYDCDVIVRNVVAVTGEWSNTFQWSIGDSLIRVYDCDLWGYAGCMDVNTDDTASIRVHVYNTRFRGITSTKSTDHISYINPGCSYIFDGCIFETINGTGYAIHNFGSDTSVPDYCILDNCVFTSAHRNSILTSINGPVLQINNCTFENTTTSIMYRNDISISNSRFNAGNVQPYGTGATGLVVNIDNCTFENGSSFINSQARVFVINISSCIIRDTSELKCYGDDDFVIISDCIFEDTAQIEYDDGCYFRVDNCIFKDTSSIYRRSSGSGGKLTVTNCDFLKTSGDAIDTRTDNHLWGHSNYFAPSCLIDCAGTCYGQMKIREGVDPDTIASTGNLVITANYDTVHITGTTTINNLYIVAASNVSTHSFGGTKIHLIADGAWDLTGAGNIIAVAGARTANDVVCLVLDAKNSKWMEVVTA